MVPPIKDPLGAGDGSGRGAFLGLMVATGAAVLGLGIILPILPHYAKTLGASNLVLGVIIAGFALTRGIFAPIVGHVSDRYGRKHLILAGLGLYAVLGVAYVFASDPLLLALVRLVQGLASVMVTPIAQSYVGDMTPEGREGEVMNIFYIGLFLGIAIGPGLGGFLSDAYGLQAPFLAMALAAVLALVLVAWLVPENPGVTPEGREQEGIRRGFRRVLQDRYMQAILTYISARGFYRWGFNAFFPVFAVDAGLSLTQVGLVLTGYMGIGAVLQWPMGRLADRWRARRTPMIVGGAFAAALPMFLIPDTTNLWLLTGLVVLMGAASAVSRAFSVALRTERGRLHGMGAVTGAFTSSLSVGQVLGPLVFGAVVDAFSMGDAFLLGGVVGVLGAIATWWFLAQADRHEDVAARRATVSH